MQLSLSILAVAAAASAFSPTPQNVESVRAEFRRALSPQELQSYSGVKAEGTSGKFYENLRSVATPEDLLLAEFNGATYKPADEADTIYLLSAGKGITANVRRDMAAQFEARLDGGMAVSRETKAQLEARYKAMTDSLTPAEKESLLNDVATTVLERSSGFVKLGKRRNYICNTVGAHCDKHTACKKFTTIEHKDCICNDSKCKTITPD
ncbi:hypothetical protein E4U54_000218 [Claviceps lovelessii]|nr:hypothetical protein E4U54_000218 [Claviceps lovelessii]